MVAVSPRAQVRRRKSVVDLRNSLDFAFGGPDSPIGNGRIPSFPVAVGANAKSNALLNLPIPNKNPTSIAAEKKRLQKFHERILGDDPIFVRSRNLNQTGLAENKGPGFMGAILNYFNAEKPTKLRDQVQIMSEITKSRRSKS